jgi:hypothetical protein
VTEDEKFSSEEQTAMKEAVLDAYTSLDDAIRGWRFNDDSPNPVNIYGLGKLFNQIWPSYNKSALFFTLNQDLFVERQWGHPSPGAPRFHSTFPTQPLMETDFVTLPKDDVDFLIERGLSNHSGIHYIKLHGSYGWRTSSGSNQMVIGANKASLIKKEPLLNAYQTLFRLVIEENNKKVLIIGYGFRDQHINQMLLKGVEDHGLKIYIITTVPPDAFKSQLEHGHYYVKNIFSGISGYFQHTLLEIFPGNQQETVHFRQLINSLKS